MLKHLGIPLSSQMLVFSKTSGAASLKRVEELVRYMLFADEAKLEGPVKVTSDFAREFARRGPRDRQGRSLRHFDLTRRMFRYPCSYLVYSAFDGLAEAARALVFGCGRSFPGTRRGTSG